MEDKFVFEDLENGRVSFFDTNKVVKQFDTYKEAKEYLKSIGLFVSFNKAYKSKNNKNFYIIEPYINQKDEEDDDFNQNKYVWFQFNYRYR